MSDDSDSYLANLQIEREREKVYGAKRGEHDTGASIQMKDRRVSSFVQWIFGALGMAAVSGIYWVGSSINSLNSNLERALVRMDYSEKRQDLTEAELRQLQKDVAELQGKVYRNGSMVGGSLDK